MEPKGSLETICVRDPCQRHPKERKKDFPSDYAMWYVRASQGMGDPVGLLGTRASRMLFSKSLVRSKRSSLDSSLKPRLRTKFGLKRSSLQTWFRDQGHSLAGPSIWNGGVRMFGISGRASWIEAIGVY